MQQVLRSRPAIFTNRQHTGMVTQACGTPMAVFSMVPPRISDFLLVLLHRDDMAHGTGGKRSRIAARDHTPPVDIRRPLALGLPRGHRTMEGTVCLRPVWHHAHIADSGRHTHCHLSSPHMVCVLPHGQHDADDKQGKGEINRRLIGHAPVFVGRKSCNTFEQQAEALNIGIAQLSCHTHRGIAAVLQ